MANTKISQLASGAPPVYATDEIPIARSGANYVLTPNDLISNLPFLKLLASPQPTGTFSGIYSNSGVPCFSVNQFDAIGAVNGATVVNGSGPLTFTQAGGGIAGVRDTAFSRAAAGVIAIGTTGTVGDTTGNLQLNQITKYNGQATAGVGISSVAAVVDLTAQGANITGTNMVTSVPADGFYRANVYSKVTRAATTSSTLPNVQINATDPDGTSLPVVACNGNSGNTLATFEFGVVVFYAKAGTAIQYQTGGYASSGATSMQYNLHIRLEAL